MCVEGCWISWSLNYGVLGREVNIWRWNELQCHFHNVTEVHLVGGTIENQYGAVDMALGEFELLYCRYSTWWG